MNKKGHLFPTLHAFSTVLKYIDQRAIQKAFPKFLDCTFICSSSFMTTTTTMRLIHCDLCQARLTSIITTTALKSQIENVFIRFMEIMLPKFRILCYIWAILTCFSLFIYYLLCCHHRAQSALWLPPTGEFYKNAFTARTAYSFASAKCEQLSLLCRRQ